jgi:RimJ/RimL family protein N-acetyltransferase
MRSLPYTFSNKKGTLVRIARPDEAKRRQLIGMYLAYQPRNSFNGLPPIKDEVCVRWVEKMITTGINLVAFTLGGRVVGHLALFPIDRKTCEMLTVVSPPEQQLGIGTELIRCALSLAGQEGFGIIRLVVESSNYVARHVYEKCGFEYLNSGLSGELDMALDLQRRTNAAELAV